MPELKNIRHEKFAQGLARGLSATAAYEQAGYAHQTRNALGVGGFKLKQNPAVIERVKELTEAAARKHEVTVEELIERARNVAEEAFQSGSYAAAVQAIKELGILSGKRVERQGHEHEGGIHVELVQFSPKKKDG